MIKCTFFEYNGSTFYAELPAAPEAGTVMRFVSPTKKDDHGMALHEYFTVTEALWTVSGHAEEPQPSAPVPPAELIVVCTIRRKTNTDRVP